MSTTITEEMEVLADNDNTTQTSNKPKIKVSKVSMYQKKVKSGNPDPGPNPPGSTVTKFESDKKRDNDKGNRCFPFKKR